MGFSWSWITDTLATGGKIDERSDVAQLLDGGITHVLNLREVDADEGWLRDAFGPGGTAERYWSCSGSSVGRFGYCWNPTTDDGKPKPTSWFKTSLDFALPALASGGKCYVHCTAGYNRGPSTAYCILRALGRTERQAWWRVKTHRPICIFGGMRYWRDAEAALKELGCNLL